MSEVKHWLIRVKDGENFRKSKYPFWGVKRGKYNCLKSLVKKISKGDIIWFFTNSDHGGKAIGMAEYVEFYDREDEPLFPINTFTNIEQGWEGDGEWDLQLHYTNLYNTEKQDIKIRIQCANTVLVYDTWKDKIKDDLILHYNNFKFYAEPIKKN